MGRDLLADSPSGQRYTGLPGRDLLEGVSQDEISQGLAPPVPSVVPIKQHPGLERFSANVRGATELGAAPVEIASELATGIPAWGVGQIAGGGSALGARLAGLSPEESAKVYEREAEKYSGIVHEGLGVLRPVTPPGEMSKAGSELVGRGLEAGLSGAKKVAGIEKFWPGIKPLEESHPLFAKFAGLATELAAFKAAHVGGARLKRRFDKRPPLYDPKNIPELDSTFAEWMKTQEDPKLIEYITKDFSDYKDFIMRHTTEEVLPGRVKGEGPVEAPKALPAPKEAVLKTRKPRPETPEKIGDTVVSREYTTPEQAQGRVEALLPEVREFLENKVGDPLEINRRLNNTLDGMDVREGAPVVDAVERLQGEINKEVKRNARETKEVVEEVRPEEGFERGPSEEVRLRDVEQAGAREATPQEVAKDFKTLLKERNRALKGKFEDRMKATEELQKEASTETTSRKARQEEIEQLAREQEAEMREYDKVMDDDWQLAEYGIKEMSGDLVDLFAKNEKGELFSGRRFTPEEIAKLHRLWQKARDMGRNLGEYIKAAMPEVSDEVLSRMEDFADAHFVRRQPFETPDKGAKTLEVIKKKKARKVLGRVVSDPPYYRKYFDMWQGMKPTRFSRAVGGEVGTVPRVFFDKHPKLKEEVFLPYRKAENLYKRRTKLVKQGLRTLKKGVGKESRRRIRDYAMAQQEGGIDLLKASGVDAIPKLTPKEMKVYETLRKEFDRFYDEVNDMRVSIGLNPFKKVDDYFTFLRTVGFLERKGLKEEMFAKRGGDFLMSEYAKMKSTPFRFRKRRGKGSYRLEDDPFRIFETYADAAIRHMEISPVVAKVRTMLSPVKEPARSVVGRGKKTTIKPKVFNPQRAPGYRTTSKYLRDWGNAISGVPLKYEAPPRLRKALGLVNRNLGASMLGANLRSALIQPTALLNTYVELGGAYTLKGVLDMMSPRKYRSAMLKSDVLFPRNFDATVGEMLGSLKDLKVSEFPKAARTFSMKGLGGLDGLTARATWNAAYAKATRQRDLVGRKTTPMTPEKAAQYADDVVNRTQASGARGEVSPIQRYSWGKTLTMFQTFVINNWNFLVYDVLGAGKNATVGEVMPKVIRLVLGASAINMLYEDLAGIKSPLPRPIKAGMESLDEGNNAVDVLIDALLEVSELMPIAGTARYGTNPFGPLAEKGGQVVEQLDPETRRPDKALELAGNVLGVPGTGQAAKSFRASKRGESPWGIAIGRYTEDDKRSRRSRKRRSRAAGR